jgi:hypothetical protein
MLTHKALILTLALIVGVAINTKQASAQETSISIQVFYDELSPYGQWISYPNYGYVWVPDAGADFVPYSSQGYWVLTDYGWTWVSEYSWGWAPFHYGRWDFDNYYGWFWVPDTQWGPSWVVWRSSPGYYGWAPMQPGISISLSFGNNYHSHHNHWVFVRERDFDRRNINHYYVHNNEHERIIRNSHVINRTSEDKHRRSTYIAGPDRTEVQKATGRNHSPRAVQNTSRPGQKVSNKNLNIYRPQVNDGNNSNSKPVPKQARQYKEEQTPTRNATTPENNKPRKTNINKEKTAPAQNRNVKPSENRNQSQPQQRVKPAERTKEVEPRKSENPERGNRLNRRK